MKNSVRLMTLMLLAVVSIPMLTGCAAFRASTQDVNVDETRHFDADFDYSDLRSITESVAGELAASKMLSESEEPPVLMIAGVQNRTSRYVDTKSLTDRVRTLLFQTGQVRFVNESRREDLLKEQGYQAAHATPESQVSVGRQLGAKYMISGALAEMKNKSPRQVRVSRKELNYYKLTFEVTDLESGELVWITEKEFARQASKPLIGW
ncbi:MAG: penicillin-binding protein activator LpoB [Verrucomicrobia bacterium]|nr:penicillin-binding protein activator LpoB [Verrucomicrobiota bacterium]